MCHLRRPCNINILLNSELLPEDRHCATHLNMTQLLLSIDQQHSLLLYLITNEAKVIDSSCVVASTCSFMHASGNQSDF